MSERAGTSKNTIRAPQESWTLMTHALGIVAETRIGDWILTPRHTVRTLDDGSQWYRLVVHISDGETDIDLQGGTNDFNRIDQIGAAIAPAPTRFQRLLHRLLVPEDVRLYHERTPERNFILTPDGTLLAYANSGYQEAAKQRAEERLSEISSTLAEIFPEYPADES